MFEVSKYEFGQWIVSYGVNKFSPYEKEIVRIILNNFDTLAQLGTAGGKRAKIMGKFIEQRENKLDTTELQFVCPEYVKHGISRLSSLTVENFRGFGPREEFEFSKRFTLFHGPNGSGKTSLCEALEYSALGNIAEASTRNIQIEKYIQHYGQKNNTTVELHCIFQNGEYGTFSPDLAAYRFCFIERNRILDFSHIGAATVKNQTNRIAALFGLSEFEHFIHEFTDTLDGRYLILQSDKIRSYESIKEDLEKKKKRLADLKTEVEGKKQVFDKLVSLLGIPDISSIEDVKKYFYDEQTGVCAIANQEFAAHKQEIIDPSDLSALNKTVSCYLEEISHIKDYNSKILMDLKSANLAELFRAVEKVEKTYSEDVCPVCRTPLRQTTEDPFRYCSTELKKLSEVETAKKCMQQAGKAAVEYFEVIKEHLSKQCIRLLLKNFLWLNELSAIRLQREDLENQMPIAEKISNHIQTLDELLKDSESLKAQMASYNESARKNNEKYSAPVKDLTQKYTEIVQAEREWTTLKGTAQKLANEVDEAEKSLNDLKPVAEHDRETIAFNELMASAYQSVVKKLVSYVSTLPGKLSGEISDKVCEYYNYVNMGDADFELINKVELPMAANEKIMLTMRDGTRQDALLFLSEGHVRILGLSILLAKAYMERLPFLVFDDIVNSIDDDHRDGVAQLLVTHPDFSETQMILTCHGEFFVSTLESYINNTKEYDRYMFLPADTLAERGVVIHYQDSTVPLNIARRKFESNELKEVGAKCRQAVEGITSKLWSKIVNGGGKISVQLRQLDSRPDLFQIVSGLSSATKNKKIPGTEHIHGLLEELQSDRMWLLLNKGTHVDKKIPEFNRVTMKELLELVEELNKEVSALKIKPTVQENGKIN